MLVVCLVILDAIFVLVELLLDLSIIKLDHGNVAPEVRHTPSLWTTYDFIILPHKHYFVAGVSLPELGSCDIFHGGGGRKAFCLSPRVFWSQVRGIRWFGSDSFICVGCCLHLPWRCFWWDRSPHPVATLEGGKNNQWSVPSSVMMITQFFSIFFLERKFYCCGATSKQAQQL